MARWIQINGELVPAEQAYNPPMGPTVLGDIKPYRSMIDGSMIESRSRHREHLKAHGMVEVGNDSSLNKPYQGPREVPGLKQTLIEVANAKLREF